MYSHAPQDYQCPFCWIVSQCALGEEWQVQNSVVYHDPLVTVFLSLHHYAGIRGNVLVVPNTHYENIFDIDCALGAEMLRVTQWIALAMKRAYHCDGISTRQHNEPAGYQDVWHFHQHVFPRYPGDHLYGGRKERYAPEERLHHANLLREALRGEG
ncbi:MAG: HIT family protein [Armatimonadota bacterium]